MDSVKTKQDRKKWINSKEYKEIKQAVANEILQTGYSRGLYSVLAKKI